MLLPKEPNSLSFCKFSVKKVLIKSAIFYNSIPLSINLY
jgi:hypothetical protein